MSEINARICPSCLESTHVPGPSALIFLCEVMLKINVRSGRECIDSGPWKPSALIPVLESYVEINGHALYVWKSTHLPAEGALILVLDP